MANEVYLRHTATGATLYFTIRNTSRQMWNTAGTPNFETLAVANWGDYDVALSESPASSYFYHGTFPAISGNMVAGWYFVEIFSRAGGSPAIGDSLIASYFGYWDGTTFKFWADDVQQVEGSDATNQIRDSVVDDSTRIDASALNTLSGHDPGGTLAGSAEVTGLNVNTRANVVVPVEIETPDASTQVYKIRLFLFDVQGNMEAPDSTPTIALVNAAGTDRSSRLSAASNPSTGVYSWDYTATAGDAEEQLNWTFTVVEGGLTRTYPATSYVVEETAYRFSSSDRATLQARASQASIDALNNLSQAQAQTAAAAALTAYDPPTRSEATADKDEIVSEVEEVVANTNDLIDALIIASGTIGATGNDATHIHLPGFTYGNDDLNSLLLVLVDMSEVQKHSRWINDFDTSTDLATIDALPITPQASTDRYYILSARDDVQGGGAGGNVTVEEFTSEALGQLEGLRASLNVGPLRGGKLTFHIGDDRLNSIGWAIPWSITNANALPDMTGASVYLLITVDGVTITAPGTVLEGTGATRSGYAELTHDDYGSMEPGEGEYQLQVNFAGGLVATLMEGEAEARPNMVEVS